MIGLLILAREVIRSVSDREAAIGREAVCACVPAGGSASDLHAPKAGPPGALNAQRSGNGGIR